MLVYYAHFMGIYNTPQEKRDLKLLRSLGFKVLNPNNEKHQKNCKKYENPMDYFLELVTSCDAVAFRPLPNGKIPAGVGKELDKAEKLELPIFELPVNPELRRMSLEKTRAYLKEIGNR